MIILRFLGNLILVRNQWADRESNKLCARLAHDGDFQNYDDDNILGIFGGALLFFTWALAIPVLLVICCIYTSYITYLLFGVVVPFFEYILTMSTLKRAIFMITALLTVRIVLFIFHYVRHAGRRIGHRLFG